MNKFINWYISVCIGFWSDAHCRTFYSMWQTWLVLTLHWRGCYVGPSAPNKMVTCVLSRMLYCVMACISRPSFVFIFTMQLVQCFQIMSGYLNWSMASIWPVCYQNTLQLHATSHTQIVCDAFMMVLYLMRNIYVVSWNQIVAWDVVVQALARTSSQDEEI